MAVVTRAGGQPRRARRRGGPVRALCEVLAYRKAGAYHSLTLVAPEVAEQAEPGQFVSFGVEGGGTLLRRPFSIYGVSRGGPSAGTVEVVFEVNGPGTEWLATRAKHDVVDIVGPLGHPFPIPQQQVGCLLVGGGYGAAPLLFLASALQKKGLRIDMIIGAATQERIFNPIEAKRLSAGTYFTTEDGSTGVKGRVTDVIDRVMDTSPVGVVYACGPMPMLAAVARIAARRKVPIQVGVEEAMACGVGVCWTCVVPYWSRGEVRNIRACVEGPCLSGTRVLWDQIGAPPDATGPPEERTS
ncbi:MAG: dihydroorotate dehydrogenase electron transfer subunit [Egibacteraceae bacterium]